MFAKRGSVMGLLDEEDEEALAPFDVFCFDGGMALIV
jgi:hypothetical protein